MENLPHCREARVWPRAFVAALAGLVIATTTVPVAHADTAGSLAEATAAYQKGDYATALADLRPLAEQGVPEAQHKLGALYVQGNGVRQDYAKAAFWYRKAAVQGFAPAQNSLGLLYKEGKGVPQDYAQAASWFSKAAAQGFAPAQANLGYLYGTGQGVPRDYAKAASLFTEAAAQGNAAAQYRLGLQYVLGYGVRQNRVIAYALFTLSSTNVRSWYTQQAAQGRERIMSEMTRQQIDQGRDLAKRLMQPGAFLRVLKEASGG